MDRTGRVHFLTLPSFPQILQTSDIVCCVLHLFLLCLPAPSPRVLSSSSLGYIFLVGSDFPTLHTLPFVSRDRKKRKLYLFPSTLCLPCHGLHGMGSSLGKTGGGQDGTGTGGTVLAAFLLPACLLALSTILPFIQLMPASSSSPLDLLLHCAPLPRLQAVSLVVVTSLRLPLPLPHSQPLPFCHTCLLLYWSFFHGDCVPSCGSSASTCLPFRAMPSCPGHCLPSRHSCTTTSYHMCVAIQCMPLWF